MKINYPIIDPHTFSISEILKELQSNSIEGISQNEAVKRTKAFGNNVYQSQKQKSILLMMISQFKSPIVYLLFFAIAVTMYFHNYIETMAILAVILINAIIGFFMELQARNSMKALKEMDVIKSKVIRDGKTQVIASEKIVPGDIIFLGQEM